MGDLAVAVIVGRLTRDAELKYTTSGLAICKFSVATSARVKKGEQWVDESSYWNVDLWGKKAESVSQYLTKGKLVAVEGDMRQDKWEKDGQQQMKVLITANDVQLLGGGAGGEGRGSNQGGGEARPPSASQGGFDGRPQGRTDYRGEEGGARPAPASRTPYQGSGRESPSQPERSPGGDDFTDDIPF
jgi:single-strand DNA-binding protein